MFDVYLFCLNEIPKVCNHQKTMLFVPIEEIVKSAVRLNLCSIVNRGFNLRDTLFVI